jgi:hypothetical protein
LIGQNVFGLLELGAQIGQLLVERILFRIFGLLQANETIVQIVYFLSFHVQLLLVMTEYVFFVRIRRFVLNFVLFAEQFELIAFLLISIRMNKVKLSS